MVKRTQGKLPLSLIFIMVLAACGGQSADVSLDLQESLQFVDDLGRSISLGEPAKRIVSLAPSNTEILFAIGAGNQLVGRDEFSDYPPDAFDVASVGGTFGDLNIEAITALEPDLILAAEIIAPEKVIALESLGLTVYWLANPTTIEGMYANLRTVAQLTDHSEEAEILIADLMSRVEAVDAALSDITEIPNVFYEIDGSDPTAPWTTGSGTFIHTLIERAKGNNIGSVLDGEFAQISVEELVIQNPNIILLGDAAFGVTVESVAERAGWDTLFAVENNLVFPFDDNLVSRPGPRLIEGLELLAQLLHPEAFE